MPEILDRCVEHVIGKGHSESSAYAICRTSLGLMSDGSEDSKAVTMSDEQMKGRVEIAMQFNQGTPLIKEMKVCGPMGRFVNGPQKGVMDKRRLARLVERFYEHPRQVPIFMEAIHPEDNDQAVAVGWVEAVRMDGANLMARVKLLGEGAAAVGGDRKRGASIYTINAKNYDGSPIGEVLKHLLLTNEPYYKELNIAASHVGGETVACVFTALENSGMDKFRAMLQDSEGDDENMKKLKGALRAAFEDMAPPRDDEDDSEKATMRTLLEEKTREVVELTAANENLKKDVEKFRSPKAMEEMQLQLKAQARQIRAEKIRRLVKQGVEFGQFDRATVGNPDTGYAHSSDEMVLAWFKNSAFKDSMDRLEIMLETMPKKRLNRTFGVGVPGVDKEVALTDSENTQIRSLGHDPEDVKAAMAAKDAKDYARLAAKS